MLLFLNLGAGFYSLYFVFSSVPLSVFVLLGILFWPQSWQVPLLLPNTHRLTLRWSKLERGHIRDEKQVSQEKCESLYAFSWYQHQVPLSAHFGSLSLPPSLSLCLLSLPPLFLLLDCLSVCLCLCARVLATDRREGSRECVLTRVCARACMHGSARGVPAGRPRQREGQTDGGREGKNQER